MLRIIVIKTRGVLYLPSRTLPGASSLRAEYLSLSKVGTTACCNRRKYQYHGGKERRRLRLNAPYMYMYEVSGTCI
jgi:hypothetical protein